MQQFLHTCTYHHTHTSAVTLHSNSSTPTRTNIISLFNLLLVITLQSFFSLAIGYYTAVSLSLALLLVITLQSLFSLAIGYYTAVSLSLAMLLVITLQFLFL